MIEYKVKPEHIRDEFISILDRVKKERILAKRSGDNMKAESYKIVVNSTFGKLGFDKYWLYDPLAMLQVTVNGQLFLMMLVEMMETNGIHCISGNTDGVELQLKAGQEELAMELARLWQERTGFELEFVYYKNYIKRDVNNYVAETIEGKVKTKGAFLDSIDLKKGYKYPIVPKAVNAYFLKGIPVEDTIRSCTDVLDFCISQKIGKNFSMEQVRVKNKAVSMPAYTEQIKKKFLLENGWVTAYHGWTPEDENPNNQGGGVYSLDEAFEIAWNKKEFSGSVVEKLELQKTNRFFVSNKGGFLQKRNKDSDGTIGLMVGQAVTILNDYDKDQDFSSYDINLDWYIRQAKDMIEEIEPTVVQTNMFENMNLSASVQSLSPETIIPEKKKATKAKDVLEAEKSRRMFPVSRSYMLVTSVATEHTPNIMVYSLSSGKTAKLKISKKLFAVQSLKAGDLINVTRFSKKPKVYKAGDEWIEIPNEVVYYIESFEVVKDIDLFIKQNRL